MTKARQATDNYSEDSVRHAFDQANIIAAGRGAILGNGAFGAATVDQTKENAFRPSVQAAIDGLVYSILPIGAVLTTNSASSPGGVAFREDLTFSGAATDTWVYVYGIQVAVVDADDGTAIAAKAKVVLDATGLFQAVVQNAAVLTITHKDRFPHVAENSVTNGVTVAGVVLDTSTDVHLCYGDWTAIHNETLGVTSVFHWMRTA